MTDERTQIDVECKKVLDQFMDALNAYDALGMEAMMHFPHVRLAAGTVKVYEQPGSNPMDLFDRLKKEDDWKYSTWRTRDLVQFNQRKAHYMLSYTRFRSDNSVIGVYESLYALTFQEERWGIQLRSSFGP